MVKLVDRRSDERLTEADPRRSAWNGPLAVVVDNGTAGPGGIVAAALLDASRAKLVGGHTFGRAPGSKAVPPTRGAPLDPRGEDEGEAPSPPTRAWRGILRDPLPLDPRSAPPPPTPGGDHE